MGTVESASCYQMILNKHVQFVKFSVTLSHSCLHVHKDITTQNVLANIMTLSCLLLTFLVNDSFFLLCYMLAKDSPHYVLHHCTNLSISSCTLH